MGKFGKELTEAWAIATVMGVNDLVEEPLFELAQYSGSFQGVEDIKEIFDRAGITPTEYENARKSLIVKALIVKQEHAIREFSVQSTPSFYVGGRYRLINSGFKADTPEGYVSAFAEAVSYLLKP